MAYFLNHEPCPQCGSKDNLARYDDGSAWCFGCRYYESPKRRSVRDGSKRPQVQFNDWEATLPAPNLEYLLQYGLTASETSLFKYSPHYDRHIYPIYDKNGECIYYEARSVTQKPKTLSHGSKVLHILGNHPLGETLVFVEDIISAIKVGRQVPCAALFGSQLPQDWLIHLKGRFKKLIFWLDEDKFRDSVSFSRQARLRGFDSKVIHSPLDPKEYSDEEVKKYLTN